MADIFPWKTVMDALGADIKIAIRYQNPKTADIQARMDQTTGQVLNYVLSTHCP